MIPLLTREEARQLDEDAVSRLGLPSLALMENAGRGAAELVLERFGERTERVVICGGPGQNGGDGWVVARHLKNAGLSPHAVLVGSRDKVKGDAATNLQVAEAMGVELTVVTPDEVDAVGPILDRATLLVDAVFGTGLDRPIEGGFAGLVERLDRAAAPVVSLDLPSGIDADTGQVLGVSLHAAATPTFAAHKRGLHQHPGAAHAGAVVPVSIGTPPPREAGAYLFEPADAGRALLPPRPADAHKGTAGHVLVVAGSEGRTGAAYLSGYGALRGGAGLVTLAARGRARQTLDGKVVELMTASLPEDAGAATREALELIAGMKAAVVGPGLGLDEDGRRLSVALARRLPVPTVLDADALTALAEEGVSALRDAAAPRVLTPHPGEAARLLGHTASTVQSDRYAAAAELAEASQQVVVLKGAGTVVAVPSGPSFVCRRGTPALAVAGTGDVLSGLVAARLAGAEASVAAPVAVVLHALAGELAARSDAGLLARELADAFPAAVERCREPSGGHPAGDR